MSRIAVTCMILLLTLSAAFAEDDGTAPSILSIIPGQGQPGTAVVLSGAGFTPDTSVYLGIEEIPHKPLSNRQISFEIPQVPAGNYALYLRQRSGAASKAYSFAVIPPKPSVASMTPDTVSFCASGSERLVMLKGKNFLEGAGVLFDGAIIKSSRVSNEEMVFSVPAVQGGIHHVQVRTQEDAVSPAMALMVNSRPEILTVTQGVEYVNYYELNIEGMNFQQGSSLMVDGKRITAGQPAPGDRDRIVFRNCNQLTYQRFPYDPTLKSFEMTVINPAGEESSPFRVSAP